MTRIPKPWKRKSDGAYYIQLDGKKLYLSKDRKTALQKYKRILANGKAPSDMTVRGVLDAYWLWLKENRAPETAAARAGILKSFGKSVPATLKAEAARPYHVQKWLDSNPRIKSDTTKNTRITQILGVFSWAKRMRYIDENPLADMPKPSALTRQEFIPAERWPEVLALATDDAFRDFLNFMLSTGCRTTEIMKFEAEHFNGHALVLPIVQSKGRKRSRVVFLPDDALAIVQKLVVANPTGKLFRNAKGKAWNRNSVRCRFRRMKEKLKMPWLTATHLRHSFAHYRLSKGQDAMTVAKLMGHVDTRMLSTRYGHLEQNTEYMLGAANQISFPSLPSEPPSPSV